MYVCVFVCVYDGWPMGSKDSLRITREGLNCQFSSFRIRSSVIRLISFSITRDVHFVGNSLDKSNLYYYYIY